MLTDLILPLVTLAVGVVGLYYDSKDPSKRWLFVGLLAVVACATATYNYMDSKRKASQQAADISRETARANAEAEHASDASKLLHELIQGLKEVKETLVDWGYTKTSLAAASPEKIQESVSANVAYSRIVESASAQQFSGVSVTYYPKNQDAATVKAAIERLGLKVNTVPPINQTATNRIWVGTAVPDGAIKFVAISLIRAGADIKDVVRIPNPSQGNALHIIVGSEPSIAGRPSLSLAKVDELTNTKLR